MAALVITTSEVQSAENGQRQQGKTFEAFTTGAALYYDTFRKAWGKASALTAASSGFSSQLGIALSTSLVSGASVQIQFDGDIILGASSGIAVGTIYILGEVSGSLYPVVDAKITHYRTIMGVGAKNGALRLEPTASGIGPGSVLNDSLTKWLFASQVTGNTPLVSPIIDRYGYEEITFFLLFGTLADSDATFTVLLEHGDIANMSDATAVPDLEMISQTLEVAPEEAASFNSGDDNEVRKLGYNSAVPRRYLRLTITPANNTGAADIAGYCELGAGPFTPVIQTAA